MEIHEQLRQARERRGFSLESLEDRTGVRVQVLRALERGAYETIPTGLYGRHAVRAYARTVGLDADATLESVARLLPQPEDPLDGLARVHGVVRKGRPVEMHVESEDESTGGDDQIAIDWRPMLAAAIDGCVLLGFAVALITLTVAAAGTSLSTLTPIAAPAWTFLIGLVSAIYFLLLGRIAHETAGAKLVGLIRRQSGASANAADRPSACPRRDCSRPGSSAAPR